MEGKRLQAQALVRHLYLECWRCEQGGQGQEGILPAQPLGRCGFRRARACAVAVGETRRCQRASCRARESHVTARGATAGVSGGLCSHVRSGGDLSMLVCGLRLSRACSAIDTALPASRGFQQVQPRPTTPHLKGLWPWRAEGTGGWNTKMCLALSVPAEPRACSEPQGLCHTPEVAATGCRVGVQQARVRTGRGLRQGTMT